MPANKYVRGLYDVFEVRPHENEYESGVSAFCTLCNRTICMAARIVPVTYLLDQMDRHKHDSKGMPERFDVWVKMPNNNTAMLTVRGYYDIPGDYLIKFGEDWVTMGELRAQTNVGYESAWRDAHNAK